MKVLFVNEGRYVSIIFVCKNFDRFNVYIYLFLKFVRIVVFFIIDYLIFCVKFILSKMIILIIYSFII